MHRGAIHAVSTLNTAVAAYDGSAWGFAALPMTTRGGQTRVPPRCDAARRGRSERESAADVRCPTDAPTDGRRAAKNPERGDSSLGVSGWEVQSRGLDLPEHHTTPTHSTSHGGGRRCSSTDQSDMCRGPCSSMLSLRFTFKKKRLEIMRTLLGDFEIRLKIIKHRMKVHWKSIKPIEIYWKSIEIHRKSIDNP